MGKKLVDLTGQKFGNLIVIGVSHKNKWGNYYWLCKCNKCGKEKKVLGRHFKKGKIRDCCSNNCIKKLNNNRKYGKIKIEYITWASMKSRCSNKNTPPYKNYGGRGITVCDDWKNCFENFYRDMGERPSKKHTLDRIDNNGNYCKENCRWATRKKQARNRRSNILLTYKGETYCISEWAEKLKVDYHLLFNEVKKHQSK